MLRSSPVYWHNVDGWDFPTVDLVLRLHSRVLRSEDIPGVRNLAGLDSAVYAPFASFGGIELHPSFTEKVAALGFYIARAQHLVSGNKRTASLAVLATLEANGYSVNYDQGEAVAVFDRLGSGTLTIRGFAAWLSEHVARGSGG